MTRNAGEYAPICVLSQSEKFWRTVSKTLKNSAKLLTANVIAQGVGLLFYPLLTRLYSAQDFGVLNLFLSIGGVLVLCATAEYQYAVLLPKSERKAVAVVQTAASIMLGVFLLCGISVFFRHSIASLFNAPELAVVYPLLPLFVLLYSAWVLCNYWFTRQARFGAVASYQVTQNLSNALFKYGAGKAGWLQWGLFGSTIASLFVSLVAVLFPNRDACKPLWRFDKARMWAAARRYARFPIFSLPRSLVNSFSCNMPIFLLTPAFGLKEAGFFGMGITLAHRPLNMVVSSLWQVFFQKTAKDVQEKRAISPFLRRVVIRGGLPIVLLFSALYFVLPSICAWLLGEEWRITGGYIRLMLPWLAATAVGGCLNFISDLFQKQAFMLMVEIVYLILRIVALSIGILYHDIRLAILLYSLVSALVIAFQIVWFFIWTKRYENSLKPLPEPISQTQK